MSIFRRTPAVVRPERLAACRYCGEGVWADEPRMSGIGILAPPKARYWLHLKCKPHFIKSVREAIDGMDDGVFG